jgi:hypothetical protein
MPSFPLLGVYKKVQGNLFHEQQNYFLMMDLLHVERFVFAFIMVLTGLRMAVNCRMSFGMHGMVASSVLIAIEFFRKEANHGESFPTIL